MMTPLDSLDPAHRLRLEALALAVQGGGQSDEVVVERAAKYEKFLLGEQATKPQRRRTKVEAK